MAKRGLDKRITESVRLALEGDRRAHKKLALLINLPFSSIRKFYGTTMEDYYALSVLASLRLKYKDESAREFLTSPKNPVRERFSSVVGLTRVI